MKHPLIQLPVDKVTISEQGKAAARRWKTGDKPFVTFLDESARKESVKSDPSSAVDDRTVEAASPIEDREPGEWFDLPVTRARGELTGGTFTFDVGSRLEFKAPPNLGSLVIRSTTRVNLGAGPYSCETNWEVFPEEK